MKNSKKSCCPASSKTDEEAKTVNDDIFHVTIEGNLNINSEIGLILPTYCEATNIEKIIREIEKLNLKTSILVIDDSSPDGTSEIVRKMQKEYDNILLAVRPKKMGLGTAITDGFRIFMSLRNPPKYVVTMDADHSHDPKEIPKLISPIKQGYHLCIGSRYHRGSIIKNWGIMRRAISKIANLTAKFVIGAKISDYTSGMRCYSMGLIKSMINELHSRTYEIQIETIRQAHLRKFKITEIPVTFTNRKKGKSKLSINEITDFISYTLSINKKPKWQK